MKKLLGRAHDAGFWEHVRCSETFSRYRDELNTYWDKTGRNFQIPVDLYSQWKLYFTIGDRKIFENVYFSKREFIEFVTLLSLVYPENDEYIERLEDVIFAVLDEYTWCLPAHQGQCERSDSCHIDLFNSETALTLATVYTLLGDRLDPLIRDRIRVEIDRRVIYPFLSPDFHEWWETSHNNWCAVCNASVGCSVMLMRPDLFTEDLQSRLVRSMHCFLSGYQDDGICTEGCAYWSYGVGFFTVFADMLAVFTDGAVNLLDNPKLRAIATFPQRMFLSGRCGVSFADGPRDINYKFGVLHRLRGEFPEDVLIYSPDYGVFNDECGRLIIRLSGAVWLDEQTYLNPADGSSEFESYAENAQWLTKRTVRYGFAAKAGHNDEMHNHNDVGSFIFAKGGEQIITDVGSGTYTAQYFSNRRYEIFEPSSRSHSVPIINGKYQSEGREFSAAAVVYSPGGLSMDISGAYSVPELTGLHRSFDLTDDGFELTDVYQAEAGVSITERIVTGFKPELTEDGMIRLGDCTLTYDRSVCTLHIGGEYGTSEEKKYWYLIDFILNDGVREFRLTVK